VRVRAISRMPCYHRSHGETTKPALEAICKVLPSDREMALEGYAARTGGFGTVTLVSTGIVDGEDETTLCLAHSRQW
jgi:hypothetical protein